MFTEIYKWNVVFKNMVNGKFYMHKLHHTTSRISLLLRDAKAKLRQSVNNNDVLRV